MKETFYCHGKLLITAEYVVLDGAMALAVPTKMGQSLEVETTNKTFINWKSLTHTNDLWYEADFNLNGSNVSCSKSCEVSQNLIKILEAARSLNPKFLAEGTGYHVVSKLEFPQNWGLGSSSTLLNNVAQWAKVDAFELSNLTFGGSGYDIACAQNSSPIFYHIKNLKPKITPTHFNPNFKEHLYFVHLNEKQNSRDGIKHYKAQEFNLEDTVATINSITENLSKTNNFDEFCELLHLHETLISNVTKQETVKNKWFSDFNGSLKSLGAWGGDFILVASKDNPKSYFESKGFQTILSWNEMILGS